MKSLAFRVALLALLPLRLLAQDVPIKLLEPELGKELGFISCKFEATPKDDQVMVILLVRTEPSGESYATENIIVSSGVAVGYTVTLIDVEAGNPDAKSTYVVVDNGQRSVLRNARLEQRATGPGRVEFKFADGKMSKTPQALSWKVYLEKFETVKSRHPDLKKAQPGGFYGTAFSVKVP